MHPSSRSNAGRTQYAGAIGAPQPPVEWALVEFLLGDPVAVRALREQVRHARAVSRCGCGCASANLAVEPTAPEARWSADTPFDRAEFVHLVAEGISERGRRVEVTLHVVAGCVGELELWTGRYGEHAVPRPETLRRLEPIASRSKLPPSEVRS